jgi:hypothetical protein
MVVDVRAVMEDVAQTMTNKTATAITNDFRGALGSIVAGLASAKPAAGTAGRYYYETDTLRLYYDTGSAWQLVGDGGITDHGGLTGLSDDDHTQYALTNGTRVIALSAAGTTQKVKMASTPSADPFQILDSTDAVKAGFTKSGVLKFTNDAGALRYLKATTLGIIYVSDTE